MPNVLTNIPFIKRGAVAALSLTLWLVALAAFGQTPLSTDVRELPPNQTLEREMTGEETHFYTFDVGANDFCQVRVEQNGADVGLVLFDISHHILEMRNSPNEKQGPETLSFTTRKSGIFVLEVFGLNAQGEKGNYTIKREPSHMLTIRDLRRIEVERLFMEGMTEQDAKNKAETIINRLSEALAGWQELGDSYMAELTARQLKRFKARIAWDAAELSEGKSTSESLRVALVKYQEASRLYQESDDRSAEAKTLNQVGVIYSRLGENKNALAYHLQALPLIIDDDQGKATALHNIGAAYSELDEYQKALDYYNQALEMWSIIIDKKGEAAPPVGLKGKAVTLMGLGLVHSILGEHQKALVYLNQALPLYRITDDKPGEASALNNIGTVHYELRDDQEALSYYNQALPLYKIVGDKSGEATSLNNIGRIYADAGKKQQALKYYNQAIKLQRVVGDKNGEAATLYNIGLAYSELGDNQKALDYYNQSLSLYKVIGGKSGEASALSGMMVVLESSNNRRMAVFYGKQSINKYQELRQAIEGLDQKTQRTFLGTIEYVYKRLADILIAEGRIVEAEQVLAMLKQEEVFDYLRRDASEADKLQQRADLSKQEADALKRYNENADKIAALGAEFGALQELQSKGIKLTDKQEKRYKELSAQIEDASRSFQVFLRQLAEEFAKRTNTEKDLQENLALQSDLKSWGEGLVFLYTLTGEDRYRVILVTPDTQVDGKFEIKAAELNDKIEKFRQAVQNPAVDPRPLGKELYDILIKPVEKQLAGAKAETLLWSLDGNLRLLPLAALWDGTQYFGQKYQNVTVTLASRTRLGDVVVPNWRALGLGVSEAKRIKEPNGARELSFSSLPAVRAELRSIIQSAESPNGVLPGQSLLDADFNETAFESQLLRGYKVIHIASHFSLNPGDSTRSFLLLGDGNVLTVDEIKNNPKLSFRGVELLTLSACQTAVVEKDSSGKEIEGFGYVAQQKGAKAILATLWSVADESTQLLMSEFYRLRKVNPQLTKAAALQMAQQEMIAGKLKPALTTGERRGTGETDTAPADYSHPYYWSPFVLIGNWR
jgi:CHAT domain-containing protein/Flp pilus assembly protein TadD